VAGALENNLGIQLPIRADLPQSFEALI